jgi:hypothetical protein
MDITGIEGPTGRLTASNSCGHRALMQGPTGQPRREGKPRVGPTGDRPTPQVGRTNLAAATQELPHGAS